MDLNDVADAFDQPEGLKRRLQAIAELNINNLVATDFVDHLNRMVDVKASRRVLKQIGTTQRIAKTAVELADQVYKLPVEDLPPQFINDIDDVAKDLLTAVSSLAKNPTSETTSTTLEETRLSQLESLEQRCKDFCTRVLPIYSYLNFKADSFRSGIAQIEEMLGDARKRIDEELKAVEKGKAEIEDIVKVTRETAAQAAVSYHAQEFGKIANEHSEASKRWLKASIALAFATIAVALISLFLLPPLGALNEPATIQRLITKIVIASILYYAAVWASKNYKTHRHLAVVNLHRQSALKTFEAFVKASSSDEQTKNAVLLEATRCIFAPSTTGYLGSEEENPSSRIIEIFKNVGGNSLSK